ncbi:GNAT family protein [Burkholderia thailandensis]|uniref:GNAT family protein n=1 Tax=Burkholderia thailandensis TaxID=57975 RepID=UPI002D779908|nr:GNAT family protein [Burkholderia thailandensis]WRS69976.1 GNAT family protein [Burkholderia thailandensis]
MRRVLLDRSDEVMRFVAERTGESHYDDYATIGLEKDGCIVAGVVFQGHNGPNVLMHFALEGSRHLITPAFIGAVFTYPFKVLRCNRVTGLVRTDNHDAQRLDEHLGFVREGVMRAAASDGTGFILYGMLMPECRFLSGRYIEALRIELARSTGGTPDSARSE